MKKKDWGVPEGQERTMQSLLMEEGAYVHGFYWERFKVIEKQKEPTKIAQKILEDVNKSRRRLRKLKRAASCKKMTLWQYLRSRSRERRWERVAKNIGNICSWEQGSYVYQVLLLRKVKANSSSRYIELEVLSLLRVKTEDGFYAPREPLPIGHKVGVHFLHLGWKFFNPAEHATASTYMELIERDIAQAERNLSYIEEAKSIESEEERDSFLWENLSGCFITDAKRVARHLDDLRAWKSFLNFYG